MNRTRVIPTLLLRDSGLVKTVKFREPRYVGDPINAVKIFNEKEVDELVFLDITAAVANRGPNFDLLADIAGEAFMPMAYGGGITDLAQVKRLFALGFEKVVLDSIAYDHPELITEAAAIYGAQSVVGCIDVRRSLLGRVEVYSHGGTQKRKTTAIDHARLLVRAGVGEILVNSIDRDGTGVGYDLKLLREITEAVSVPVIACGGAGTIDHFAAAVEQGGVSAVAAGSMFVFYGPHRAVLINYPERKELVARLP